MSGCHSLSQTFESDAPLEDFWAIYTDASVWHEWTPEIKWATIQGDFEPGATGKCRFKGLPATPYAVGRVDAPRRFVTLMDFRFAKVEFDHVLEPREEGGVRVTEQMTFCGPFAGLFYLLQRRRVRRTWPEAMRRLTALALSRSDERRSRPAPSPSAVG